MTEQCAQSRIDPIDAGDVPAIATGLAAALAGIGPAVAPLPIGADERLRALAMYAPDDQLETPVAAVVATSGSTGHPKGVMLSAAAIRAGVAATHAVLGGVGSWHLAVPAHFVAGLMVIARSVVAGTDLVTVPDLDRLRARAGSRNYLSLVPTQLRRVRQHPTLVERLAEFDAVLVGGAASTPEELDWWAEHGVRIVTTYGMSETSGGCVYDGRPLPGVEIELEGEGRVSITGEVVFSGYRLRPDLTADVLTTTDGRRTLLTHDRAEWVDGRLRLLGRLDDVVISGGINVDLAEVERVAQRMFGDADLVAVGVPDPEWGTLVALVGRELPSLQQVRATLAGEMARTALPRAIGRGAPPLTSGGKIDRREIVRQWASFPGREQL